jgi:hypothetical protein
MVGVAWGFHVVITGVPWGAIHAYSRTAYVADVVIWRMAGIIKKPIAIQYIGALRLLGVGARFDSILDIVSVFPISVIGIVLYLE